jgi:CRP-like cAMP-binding protein
MSDAEVDDIVGLARELEIPRGQPVLRQGDPAGHFYFLLCGRLKVTQLTKDGQQIVVRIVNPGEFFGIAKALQRTDYPGTAVTTVDSVALAWNSTLWNEITTRHSALAMNALYDVANHLQEMHARMRELSTESVERRIAHALVRLVTRAGRKTAEGILIDFPIARQDIAEMTGTTISTVSRTLSAWANRGLIKSGRLRITVRDPQELLRLTRE